MTETELRSYSRWYGSRRKETYTRQQKMTSSINVWERKSVDEIAALYTVRARPQVSTSIS